jgi:hypothetical protein
MPERLRLPNRQMAPTPKGRPLETATRARMERRLGHDFSSVRVHSGGMRDAEAHALGEDITFAPGRFDPGTRAGEALLSHELAHVVQQRGGTGPYASAATAEREAAAAARGPVDWLTLSPRPVAIHRQPQQQKPAGMTRAALAKDLEAKLGHPVTMTIGTKARQAKDLRLKLPATWASWDPGTNNTLYNEIAQAFTDVNAAAGGLPEITEVIFYETHYEDDGHGNGVPHGAPASLDGRVMAIYKGALFAPVGASFPGIHLPGERSRQDAKYKTKSAAQGTGPGAPIIQAMPAESQRRAVAHELGHGVQHANTGDLTDFADAVGWSGGKLYDIQAKGVAKAIAEGTTPPAAAEITQSDWNAPKHKEQPLRAYQATTVVEDYAESLMQWVYVRDVLKVRSPARFKFFNDPKRRAAWQAKLVPPGGKPAATTPATKTPAKTGGGS